MTVGLAAPLVGCLAAVLAWRWGRAPVFQPAGGVSRLLLAAGLGGAVAVGGWLAELPAVVVAGPMLVAIAMAEKIRRAQAAESRAINEQLPILVDVMIQELRSGVGLASLCRRPPSVSPRLDAMALPMVTALAAGCSLAEAVTLFGKTEEPLVRVRRFEGSRLVAVTLGVVAARGGPAVPALQRLRLTLTGLAQARADGHARASQAMASARLLIMAPAVFALLLATFDHDLAQLYLRQPVGALCVGLCVGLSYGGWRWMGHIVAKVVEPPRFEAVR